MTGTKQQRHRQERSIRNDESILDAATELLGDAGWGGFALATVAPRAGLSKRPILDRFDDRQALAIAVWRNRVVRELVPALDRLLDPATPRTADDLEAAMEPFLRPSAAMRAGSELLVVRGYEPRIRRVVDASLQKVFEATDPAPGRRSRADAARNTFLMIIALGFLQSAGAITEQPPSMSLQMKRLCEALATDVKPVRQPSDTAAHLEAGFVFNVDDPVLNTVLQVVLEEVGQRGFDGATMSRITQAADVSEGYIFGRYKTKLDLFVDASDRSMANNMRLNHEFMRRVEGDGPAGLGDAVGMREFMAPGRELLRAIQIEQARLTRHSPALRAALQVRFEQFLDSVGGLYSPLATESVHAASFYFGLAYGTGTNLMAQLRPQTWELPFDVVTVPWATFG